MEAKSNNIKKAWSEPRIILISKGNINNGVHPTFHEIGPGASSHSFIIEKNTPSHKTYHTSTAGWNFAGHS